MIRENLGATHSLFGDDDPARRVMLKGILGVEAEHANDMLDLLVAHEGKPLLRE